MLNNILRVQTHYTVRELIHTHTHTHTHTHNALHSKHSHCTVACGDSRASFHCSLLGIHDEQTVLTRGVQIIPVCSRSHKIRTLTQHCSMYDSAI